MKLRATKLSGQLKFNAKIADIIFQNNLKKENQKGQMVTVEMIWID